MPRKLLIILALALIVVPSATSAPVRWTPARAEARLKTWTTTDPKWLAVVDANLRQQLLAVHGDESDPTVVSLRAALARARHAAVVTRARCAGLGRAVRGRYASFRCSAIVVGKPNTPPDYRTYRAALKLRLRPTGSSSFAVAL